MIHVLRDLSPDTDFLELNPHFRGLKPFDGLVKKFGKKASVQLWGIFAMADPHPSKNPFYNIPIDERVQVVKDTFPGFDPEDETVKLCIESWSDTVLTDTERNLKGWRDKLVERDQYLRSMAYDFDTAELLDKLLANSPKLWEMYKKVAHEFMEEENKLTGKGSKKMTQSEQGMI